MRLRILDVDTSQKWTLTGKIENVAEIDVQCQSLSIAFVCAVQHEAKSPEWAKITCFYFDIKNDNVVLWVKNFSWDTIRLEITVITSEKELQTV